MADIMDDNTRLPVLARVYKLTVQRIACDLQFLHSSATFLLICDRSRNIYIWIGQYASINDTILAEGLAVKILRYDYLNKGHIVIIKDINLHKKMDEIVHEKQENFISMLDQLSMNIDDYIKQSLSRPITVENYPIRLSILERKRKLDSRV